MGSTKSSTSWSTRTANGIHSSGQPGMMAEIDPRDNHWAGLSLSLAPSRAANPAGDWRGRARDPGGAQRLQKIVEK